MSVGAVNNSLFFRRGNFWKKLKRGDKIFINGVWQVIKDEDKVFYNGEWHNIFPTPIPLPDFDYFKIEYSWTVEAGTDLDTLTGFVDTGTADDNNYVGYGQGDAKVPDSSSTPRLWWAGDNTAGGKETVLVDFKQFITDFPSTDDIIKVRLNAIWYSQRFTGNIQVSVTTYKGGTMSIDSPNFDFINTGGTVVSNESFSTNVLNTGQGIENSQDLAIVQYNKVDNTASLIQV